MNIEVKGHSGCQIDVVREGEALFVYKSSRDKSYNNRLILQGKKQLEASKLALQHIRVPEIFEIKESNDSALIKMEYVYSKNFIGYFEYAGFEQINYFIKALCLFLDFEIKKSSLQTVGAHVVKDKFDDVQRKTLQNPVLKEDKEVIELINQASTHFECVEDMQLPVGLCHGDLTFSNILFNGNNYYLIDFLDSFVESPLLDIVKIRQDSAFLWSQLMFSGDYDEIRLRIVADKIDQEINRYASGFYWYNQYYHIFQLMNFLRVLQYARDKKVITYLKNIINRLLHEFYIDSSCSSK